MVSYDVFDLVVLDDLGYVQQLPEEAEVLFTLMAERYERKSLLITSNLVFSQWDRIFRNPMIHRGCHRSPRASRRHPRVRGAQELPE
jgi:DNA replication protein DnaC